MSMRAALLCVLVACGRTDPRPPAAAPADAARGIDAAAGATDEWPRERGVPPRDPCRPDCAVPAPVEPEERGGPSCERWAPGILGQGRVSTGPCQPGTIAIDCCAPLPVDDGPAVPAAMGWARADGRGRQAIAWTLERVAHMQLPIEDMKRPWPADAPPFSPPTSRVDAGAVVLDYWQYVGDPMTGPSFAHRRVRYALDGARAVEELARVTIPQP